MPRVSRTDVEFPVEGQLWIARFDHQHDDKKGVWYQPKPGDPKGLRVKHITRCKLSHKGKQAIFVTGMSPCSLKDEYDWRFGIRRAFQKALERAGFCEFIEADGHETIKPLKAQYAEAMKSFFTEMKIKDYWPHNGRKPIAGEVVDENGRLLLPAETKNGTYHLGAD
jgi:hypothetical protein